MSILQDCRIINLNSKDALRLNGDKISNLLFNMTNLIKDDVNMLYSTIGIVNCQIPVSWYLINSSNCNLNVNVGGTYYTLVLTKGNYNATTFFTEISYQFSTIGVNLVITINRITGVLNFNFNGTTVILYHLGSEGLFRIIGFDLEQDYTGSSITPPYPLNLLGVKKLKVNSNYLATNSYDSGNTFGADTIHTIPVDVPAFGLITFLNQSSTYGKMRLRRINIIDIQILDEYNNFIEFNNIDWSITLQLVIYRKYQEETSELIVKPLNTTLEKIDEHLQEIFQGQQPVNFQDTQQQDTQEQPLESQPTGPEIMYNPNNDLDLLLYENHGVI